MNTALYNSLIKQYQDNTTVTRYFLSKDWVESHIKTLCEKFGWLSVGGLVKHTISGTTRVSKVKRFIVNEHNLLVDVGFGNIWYYECTKPSSEEMEKFDGHCLILD